MMLNVDDPIPGAPSFDESMNPGREEQCGLRGVRTHAMNFPNLLQAAWVAFLAGMTAGTPVVAQSSPDPSAIVQRSDRALAALETLRADFTQTVENPVLERTTTGRGALTYRAPDRFRIAYTDPAGDVVVNDGARVWIYLPSSQPGQVIRQPAGASGVRNPLTYLRDLRQAFTARHAGVETVAGAPADHLALLPEGPDAPFARLDVWVDRGTNLPRQVRTRTREGVVTTYTFREFRRNVSVDPHLFRFSPPEGVEIFDQ